MRIALIDADVLAVQSAIVAEKAIDWGDDLWTLHADAGDGERIFRQSVDTLQEITEADKVILAFSDSANWRKQVLTTYKANRAGVRQPLIRAHLKKWASEEYEAVIRPTLEGDDVLGILATRQTKDELIVCSIDKDFKTVPGKHYNFGKQKFFEVNEAQANYHHLLQALTGDTVDGYAGCPGVGPVAAEKILQPFLDGDTFDLKEAWKAVVATYDKKGLGEEEALTQARVARICRAEDYDFRNKTVKLWTPVLVGNVEK